MVIKARYTLLVSSFFLLLLFGCGEKIEGETGPFVAIEAGPAAVEVALSLTTDGALKVVGSYAHTLIEKKPLKMGWQAAIEYVLQEANHQKYTLYVVYQTPEGEIYQDVYEIGKPFRVTFTEREQVKIIESFSTGSIIVRVKIQPPPDTSPAESAVSSPIENTSPSNESTMSPPCPQNSPTREPSQENSEETPCANSPKRLSTGEEAQVCTYKSGEPVRIRNGPGIRYSSDHELNPGAVVNVIDGPVCDADSGWWYWKIETKTKHYIGWMAEGGDQKDPYFLCPYP